MGNLQGFQKDILQKYFTNYEIDKFDNAKTPKGELQPNIFDTNPFRTMVTSRKSYVLKLIDDGKKLVDIKKTIEKWYKAKNDRSPFDWLKVEYRPAKKLSIKQLAEQLELKRERKSFKATVSGGLRAKPKIIYPVTRVIIKKKKK